MAQASAGELGERTRRQADWVAGLHDAGVLSQGGRIAGGSLRVRNRAGRPAVIDVPADAVGAVRSWLLVEAADLEAAVGLAESCPEAAFGAVRVLPIDASDACDASGGSDE